MNIIEKELEIVIHNSIYGCSDKKLEEVAKSCLSIVEKYAVGFAVFCMENTAQDLNIDNEWVLYKEDCRTVNSAELFQLYIQSLGL